jgi:hypothetical protein
MGRRWLGRSGFWRRWALGLDGVIFAPVLD